MTYHLASFRLKSIGEQSSRFTDLTMTMTAPEHRTSGFPPCDTVLWLRNGGGKSSLLSLFYAHVLPRVVDFMGRSSQRSLTDYVQHGDTSHTVAVWHPVNRTNLLGHPDHVLVTGAIYEWDDLRRPADPDKDRDRLNVSWYSFFTVPGVIEPDTLPLLDAQGRPHRKTAFLTALRQIHAAHPQAMDLQVPRNQQEWASVLKSRGLDPDLFRTQKQMNHTEGGVEELFKFSSAREFINFLLDLTVRPQDVSAIAEDLATISTTLAAKPAKVTERDFCREAAAGLRVAAHAHQRLITATSDLTAAQKNAADASAAFAATVTAADSERDALKADHDAADRDFKRAQVDQALANNLTYLYRLHAAGARANAAKEAHAAARDHLDEASRHVQAWRLTDALADAQDLTSRIEAVRQEAAQERHETAPLRQAHDQHAAALRARLASLRANTLAQQAEHAAEGRRLDAQAAESEQESRDARAEAARASEAAATAADRLSAHEQALTDAAETGLLDHVSQDPQDALADRMRDRDRVDADLRDVRARRAQRPQKRQELTSRLGAVTAERTRQDAERGALASTRASLTDRAKGLAGTERLRALTEASEGSPVDLWGEKDVITRRLTDEIIKADEALVRDAAAGMDDHRALEHQTRTGLWPTSLDAARVHETLTAAGVQAETGWDHLRALLPSERLHEALSNPTLNRVGCGLVVPTEQAEAATRALQAQSAVTTALVGVYTAQAATLLASAPSETLDASAAWTGLHQGLVDADYATSAADTLRVRQEDYETHKHDLAAGRDHDRALLADLTRFLDDCPDGHLDALGAQLDDLDTALGQCDADLDMIRGALDDLSEQDQRDAAAEERLTDRLTSLSRSIEALTALANQFVAAIAWRSDLAQASKTKAEFSALADRADESAAQSRSAAESARGQAARLLHEATGYEQEAARVRFLDIDQEAASDTEGVTLDALRDALRDAARAYEVQTANSVLAERERGYTEQLQVAQARIHAQPQSVRDAAVALLSSDAGQTHDSRTRAIASAESANRDAAQAVGTTASTSQAADEALRELRERRTDLPRRTLPVEPRNADHADDLAVEQEEQSALAQEARSAAERTLNRIAKDDDFLAARIGTFTLLQDGLPDPAGDAAEPFSGDNDAAASLKREVLSTLTTAAELHHQAESHVTQAVADLRATGGKYGSVKTPSRDRIVNDREAILAANADDLANSLTLRAEMIEQELDAIAKDQAIITDRLAHQVSDSLDLLRKAERYSKLPATLGAWANKHMLRVRFDAPNESDLRTYIDRVIERRLRDGVKPEGIALLKDAIHESVGPRGFNVKVLKPTLDQEAATVDITRLGKWSGGEKLTVCVALYCTIAALRAANSGRAGQTGGVLLLDNPIGRASRGTLVRLQRDVAAARGVQLVYTTGVKDPDAVSRFPNVIRLENRAGRTSGRRHIQEVPDGEGFGTLTAARVAHSERAEPS